MSKQSPLIVPIVVEAFVVNDHTRRTGTFYRAPMTYNDISDLSDGGWGSTDPNFNQTGPQWSQYYNGVYLKWRLPDALTRGGVRGSLAFPCVPNRWLIVRSAPLSAGIPPTAWIVESDYIGPNNASTQATVARAGSIYVQPTAPGNSTPVGVLIGQSVPLATGSWREPGHTLKLTAVAPGNPAFAYYQPACNNVFSMVDPLDGHAPETFSYQVFGWFSTPADDPLSKVCHECDFLCVLDALGWKLPPGTDPALTADWSLMSGMVTGVSWQTATLPPGGPPQENPPVSIAVGNTAVEALTALIAGQGGRPPGIDTDLLEAFQLGLVDVFEKSDPSAALADAVHSSFFQKFSGGYGWEIVDAPGTNSQEDQKELEKERQWLAILNQDQQALDLARRQLAGLQRQLYVLWWKYVSGELNPFTTDIPGLTQDALGQQLNPAVAGSLAHQVSQQQDAVKAMASPLKVPGGDTPDALAAAIKAFAKDRDLPSSRLLKRTSAPVFYEPNNPVVLIAGAGASGIVPRQPAVCCRFPSQVVRGFECDKTPVTASTPKLTIPVPSLTPVSGVPWLSTDLPVKLVQECFLLDPGNAGTIATATGLKRSDIADAINHSTSYGGSNMGTLPSLPGAAASWTRSPWAWTQNPWHPLLLLYAADYYPIDFGAAVKPNWTYADGQYSWNGTGAYSADAMVGLNGVLQLSPAAAFNMQSRIEAFLENNPDLDPKTRQEFCNLLQFVRTHDSWDLLSQALDGFNQQLLLNLPGVWLAPGTEADPISTPTLAELIGPVHANPPAIGTVPQSGPFTSSFLPWRCGQFVLTNLAVVDEWGQAVYPIAPSNDLTDTVYMPPEMKPAPLVIPSPAPDSVMQLTPGLLQPGRLDFELVSATNDHDRIGLTADADPICGWVLPNHLDAALMAYDGQGTALGEMSVGVAASDQPVVCWVNAPGSPYHGLDDINARIKHLGPFLWNLQRQPPATFAAFLHAIDETLWTTLPLGAAFDEGLAALIGRPLALVRARLQFELNGPADADPSWQYTFPWTPPPPPPAPPLSITGYPFAIELGNLTRLEDGLIGYFSGEDYTRFNVTDAAVAESSQYLHPIGVKNNYVYLRFDPTSTGYVSMLVDPRAAVHARTGILPTLRLALAPEWTTAALAAMNVTFRVNGILTDSKTVVSPKPATTVLLPVPHEKRGRWAWIENDEGQWQQYPTAPNDTTARLATVLPVLRRGLLQLSAAVGDTASPRPPAPNRRSDNLG